MTIRNGRHAECHHIDVIIQSRFMMSSSSTQSSESSLPSIVRSTTAGADDETGADETARAVDDLQRTLLDTQQKINDAIAVSLTHGVGGVGGLSGVGCR